MAKMMEGRESHVPNSIISYYVNTALWVENEDMWLNIYESVYMYFHVYRLFFY